MADLLRQRGERMQWYRDELLHMAKELGHRLLPAFNTTSGLPYPKVFLIFIDEYYRSYYFCQAKCVGEMCVCVSAANLSYYQTNQPNILCTLLTVGSRTSLGSFEKPTLLTALFYIAIPPLTAVFSLLITSRYRTQVIDNCFSLGSCIC